MADRSPGDNHYPLFPDRLTDLPLSFGLDAGAVQSAKNKMEMDILNTTKAKEEFLRLQN